ncbi:MAG: hypothetical protein A2X64_01350 [Ignavibacteria bacterium GWF2_33_9]|nr:MAG: hypothetical protein A2X64_01350 [Ignavibacteria bacterium GWF2_33_9]
MLDNLRKILNLSAKPTIFLIIFFVSFFSLIEAEDHFQLQVNYTPTFPFEYEKNINKGLLTMLTDSTLFVQEGGSSFYGKRFHNRRTASGQIFDMNKYTAAHRKLPFGTIVQVTNMNSGKTSIVIINDRGPYHGKRIIDLSKRVADQIGTPGIPPIKIKGVSNENYPDSTLYTNKFIVFPLIKDVTLAESFDINFMKKYEDFDEAIIMLHTLQDLHPSIPYCLAVYANQYFDTRFDRTYYVGILLKSSLTDSIVKN